MNATLEAVKVNARKNDWLLACSRNVYSQSGEDGIVAEIFKLIPEVGGPPRQRWCVEFGAWDGKKFSNTANLLLNQNWHGVMIEAEPGKFKELTACYGGNSKVACLNEWVTFDGAGSLDSLLAKTAIPEKFDLLSIDIDGNDIHIWDSLKKYRPRVVVIEFNPSIPHNIAWAQARDMSVRQGSSLKAIVELGRAKGYELICVTELNAIFVLRELFAAFGISNNSMDELHKDTQYITQVFQLYDGTLVWQGCKQMLWHGVPIKDEKMQVLPRELRFLNDSALDEGKRKLLDEGLKKLR